MIEESRSSSKLQKPFSPPGPNKIGERIRPPPALTPATAFLLDYPRLCSKLTAFIWVPSTSTTMTAPAPGVPTAPPIIMSFLLQACSARGHTTAPVPLLFGIICMLLVDRCASLTNTNANEYFFPGEESLPAAEGAPFLLFVTDRR